MPEAVKCKNGFCLGPEKCIFKEYIDLAKFGDPMAIIELESTLRVIGPGCLILEQLMDNYWKKIEELKNANNNLLQK